MIGVRSDSTAHSIAMIPSEDDNERRKQLAERAQAKGEQQCPQ
jgi:hypothetical protein